MVCNGGCCWFTLANCAFLCCLLAPFATLPPSWRDYRMMQSSMLVPHLKEHFLSYSSYQLLFICCFEKNSQFSWKMEFKFTCIKKAHMLQTPQSAADAMQLASNAMHVGQNKTLNLNPKKTSSSISFIVRCISLVLIVTILLFSCIYC